MSTLLEYLMIEFDQYHCKYGLHADLPFILDNLGRSVTHGSARRLSDLIPNDLGQAKVGEFDDTDTSTTNSRPELAFVFLFFVVWTVNWVLGRDDRYALEQQVFRLDVTMHDTSFLMQVTDGIGDLQNDMPREVFAEVREFDNLVKQFATLHDCEERGISGEYPLRCHLHSRSKTRK